MWTSVHETPHGLSPSCGGGLCGQAGYKRHGLCKDTNRSSLWHSCCGHKGVPTSPGSRDLFFLFGITARPGTDIVIILSGSCPENHRIAGIWGIIQETSALSKTINLPIHPASLNWVPATWHPKCWQLGAQPGTEQMQTSQAACVLFHHDKGLHSHSLSWYPQQGRWGCRDRLFPASRWGNRGWGESRVTCGQSQTSVGARSSESQLFLNPELLSQ